MDLKLLGRRPARDTTGHPKSSLSRLQVPVGTGAQEVQDDMSKTHSVKKEREFIVDEEEVEKSF